MRRLEAFSGVRVLTCALMSNYFHLRCEVPEPEVLSELAPRSGSSAIWESDRPAEFIPFGMVS